MGNYNDQFITKNNTNSICKQLNIFKIKGTKKAENPFNSRLYSETAEFY